MKKIYLLLLLSFSSLVFSQNNEVKFNLAKLLDLSYERKLSHHFSAGMHLGTGIVTQQDVRNRLFLKSFGRYYFLNNQDFSKLYTQFSMVYFHDEYFPSKDPNISHSVGLYDELGITGGIGYKFLIIKKFTIDIYADLGIELLHPKALLPLVADGGLNFGYRF